MSPIEDQTDHNSFQIIITIHWPFVLIIHGIQFLQHSCYSKRRILKSVCQHSQIWLHIVGNIQPIPLTLGRREG